ncbi:MAG: hypothetical protein FWD26_11395 [Treponema sp.]|nr:hypothetical protein [Treponema sp.]
MKKIMFLFFLLAILAGLSAQNAPNAGQVAYYKQTAVVDQNRNRSNGDNTGQFICFTRMGCYDSNNQGHDIGNGFLQYMRFENNLHVYYGTTYWGQGSYFFNNDFSRLNIRTDAGITYVYEKTNTPAGVVTSAKIRSSTAPVTGTAPGTVLPPPTINPSSGGSQVIIKKCGMCNGSGNCNLCNGNPRINCTYCSGVGKRWTGYGNNRRYENCAVCNGKGYNLCVSFGKTCMSGKCSTCRGKGELHY